MPIALDRGMCCDLNQTMVREWLITNGIGGYAAGTVAGVLTRNQHGLLVADLPGEMLPQLLLAKVDEEVVFDQRTYYLGTNEYRDGTIKPAGFVHLESFHLEDGFSTFTYRLGGINGIVFEKRIWMPPEQNTTCIQYRVISTNMQERADTHTSRGTLDDDSPTQQQRALMITLLPFTTYRPYNQLQSVNQHFQLQADHFADHMPSSMRPRIHISAEPLVGCTISATSAAQPYHMLALSHPDCHPTFIPTGVWYGNFLRRHDSTAEQPAIDDLYLPGVVRAALWPDDDVTLTLVVSAEPLDTLQYQTTYLAQSYRQSHAHQQDLFYASSRLQQATEAPPYVPPQQERVLPFTTTSDPQQGGEDYLRLLLQAGDHFLIRPQSSSHPYRLAQHVGSWTLRTNYFGLAHKTRDTLIALPGLTLVTGRYEEAEALLSAVAQHFQAGMLPDHVPMPGHTAQVDDYNNVDNTLWFFYALDHYVRSTQHYAWVQEHYASLKSALDCYIRGTSNGIHFDLNNGLLYAQQSQKALTWMDAYADDRPVTPRGGAAVEVNALWYHALSLMQEWSHDLGHTMEASYYQELRTLCSDTFQRRFWYEQGAYLYDVVDGPEGDDAALRPNQLLALSLRHAVLDAAYWQPVYEAITQHLLTPFGLRTLSPHDAAYHAHIGQTEQARALAQHQGSVWPWLLGPYVDAVLMMQSHEPRTLPEHDKDLFREYIWRRGLRLLEPFKERLQEDLLGTCAGVLDGNAPHKAGCYLASALSTGELLRIYDTLAHIRVSENASALRRS